ncbi:MAG: cupin domain-containing protein [Sphingomonadales bacterium]|nr:cupin domain-containing protein [Sphingomonadales bacterium]MDE2169779.1 cupin domain-containing protein [Sphingomonadales bacterium]
MTRPRFAPVLSGTGLFAAALLAVGLASPAFAQEVRLTPAEIARLPKAGTGPGTSGLAGLRITILSGDPTREGPYTIALRVPAHTSIAAHTHRDARKAVVVSGMWYFGYGSRADPARVKRLPPGSFYTEPAADPHFALTRDQPAVVYITGWGPSDTVYVARR